jgi:hypothetical protein
VINRCHEVYEADRRANKQRRDQGPYKKHSHVSLALSLMVSLAISCPPVCDQLAAVRRRLGLRVGSGTATIGRVVANPSITFVTTLNRSCCSASNFRIDGYTPGISGVPPSNCSGLVILVVGARAPATMKTNSRNVTNGGGILFASVFPTHPA